MQPLDPYVSLVLNGVLKVLLPVLATLLTGFLIQQVRLLEAKIKTQRPDVFAVLQTLASLAVRAAEQANLIGLIEDKKAYAIDFVTKELASLGLKIDVAAIEAAIEAAVFSEINKDKPTVKKDMSVPAG